MGDAACMVMQNIPSGAPGCVQNAEAAYTYRCKCKKCGVAMPMWKRGPLYTTTSA